MGGFSIQRKRFLMTGSIGVAVLAILLTLLVATGSVFAAFPISGIGGFVISASTITGQGFELIPSITDTNDSSVGPAVQGKWPCAQTCMDDVVIDGLKITKDISLGPLSQILFNGTKTHSVVTVTAGNGVHGTGLVMQMTGLTCDNASFPNAMEMDENMATSKPSALTPLAGVPLGMNAQKIVLTNAQVNTHNMKASTMSIPTMALTVDTL